MAGQAQDYIEEENGIYIGNSTDERRRRGVG